MGKTSTASKRKYNEKAYERIALVVPKGSKDVIKAAAEQTTGGSINGYVNQAINERLQKDGFSPMQKQIAEPDRAEQSAEPMQEQERNEHAGN